MGRLSSRASSVAVPEASRTASAAAMASGVASIRDLNGEPGQVICWAGDGGTFDIGLQSLSGAVERNEDCIFVCYDNEAYMNTGVQRSSSTPFGVRTTTTPGQDWKKTRKKDIMEIMAAHRIPYAATANIAYPGDLVRKVEKAKAAKEPAKSPGDTKQLYVTIRVVRSSFGGRCESLSSSGITNRQTTSAVSSARLCSPVLSRVLPAVLEPDGT